MFCIAAFLPFSYLMNLLARCFHAMYIIIYLMVIAFYILQNLDWIFIKIDLTFLDPNWLWQAFYLLKIIPKSSAFSFIGELFSHVIFNKFVFFMYFCVLWHNHYINMTRHPPPRRVKIFYGKNWASWITSFPNYLSCWETLSEKVSSQMQVYSLSHTNCPTGNYRRLVSLLLT